MSNDTSNDEVLVDEMLDDLADLPSSKPFPTGAHAAKMFLSRQKDKTSTIIAKFKHTAVMELTNATDVAPNPGDEATIFIHTKKKDKTPNEFGQGQLKQLITPIAERIGAKSVNECLEATKDGIDVAIVTGIKKGTDGNPDQMTIAKIMLV
jgi:hypothetical protein